MKLANRIVQLVLIVSATFFVQQAHADDQEDVKQLIQNLYREDVKPLMCADPNGDQNKQLVSVPEKYFSADFMKYYRPVCVNLATDGHGHIIWIGDIRSGEQDSYSYEDSKAGFTNLNIEQPKVKGSHARIRTTYDLPVASYKKFGNFTVFSLIKENGQWKIDDIELGGHDFNKANEREVMTGLQVIKSLKRFIKNGLEEAAAEKKASVKK
jgi:hypothetical protein